MYPLLWSQCLKCIYNMQLLSSSPGHVMHVPIWYDMHMPIWHVMHMPIWYVMPNWLHSSVSVSFKDKWTIHCMVPRPSCADMVAESCHVQILACLPGADRCWSVQVLMSLFRVVQICPGSVCREFDRSCPVVCAVCRYLPYRCAPHCMQEMRRQNAYACVTAIV